MPWLSRNISERSRGERVDLPIRHGLECLVGLVSSFIYVLIGRHRRIRLNKNLEEFNG